MSTDSITLIAESLKRQVKNEKIMILSSKERLKHTFCPVSRIATVSFEKSAPN